MANKLEQIALKKQREAEEAREAEIKSLAIVIATETISRIKNLSADEKKPLEATISELAKGLAEAVALSNEKLGGDISVSFSKLVENFKSAIPEKFDNKPNDELFAKIADGILKFDNAIKSLELNPTINLKGITATELKNEVDRLIEKLPKDAKDSVKIEYEKAGATNYINVRLTDGINFYKAFGGGGGGGSSSPTVDTGDGVLAVPVANPDGTPLSSGGASGGRWANYADARQDLASDPMYFGKEDLDGNFVIKQFGITSNTTLYYEGTGGIADAWDDRATYDYVEYNELT